MIELFGWGSSILLASCAFPQALKSLREKSSEGISKWFLWTWFIGEVTGLIYVIHHKNPPLIINYMLNTVFVGIILYYAIANK